MHIQSKCVFKLFHVNGIRVFHTRTSMYNYTANGIKIGIYRYFCRSICDIFRITFVIDRFLKLKFKSVLNIFRFFAERIVNATYQNKNEKGKKSLPVILTNVSIFIHMFFSRLCKFQTNID